MLILDEVMSAKNITRYKLAKLTDTHYSVIDKYYHNKITRYDKDILRRICIALDCEVGDIVKIKEVES